MRLGLGPVAARLAGSCPVFWLDVLDVLQEDFGPVPAFTDEDGLPRIFVVGGHDRVAILFTCLPETLVVGLAGLRACQVIGHPAFAAGTHNGETLIVEAVNGTRPGEAPEALVLTFSEPLNMTDAI